MLYCLSLYGFPLCNHGETQIYSFTLLTHDASKLKDWSPYSWSCRRPYLFHGRELENCRVVYVSIASATVSPTAVMWVYLLCELFELTYCVNSSWESSREGTVNSALFQRVGRMRLLDACIIWHALYTYALDYSCRNLNHAILQVTEQVSSPRTEGQSCWDSLGMCAFPCTSHLPHHVRGYLCSKLFMGLGKQALV